MKKLAGISVFISTAIEVYDLSLFAFLIPVLSAVYFPDLPQQSAINFTVLAYVVSYIIKPFSGMVFGYMSDNYGRKPVLSLTTILMTLSTAAIGLLPVGMPEKQLWSILVLCRIIQGFSISGEFSNGVILAVEQGSDRPGLAGSLAFTGGIMGLLLANVSVYILYNIMPHEQLMQYGWRVPFLASAVVWFSLFQIRRFITEPFIKNKVRKNQYISLLKNAKKELAICFIAASLSASAFYMTFVYMPTFLTSIIHSQTHQKSLSVTIIALAIYLICLPLFGSLADRVGIKKQLTFAAMLYLTLAYVSFEYISHLNLYFIFGSLITLAVIQSLYNSALPAYMISLFPAAERGKALAIAYNTALSVFGGLMPYVILSHGRFINPGIVITGLAIVTLMVLRSEKD